MSSSDTFDAAVLITSARRYVFSVHGQRRWPRRHRPTRPVPQPNLFAPWEESDDDECFPLGSLENEQPRQPTCAEIIHPENLLRVYQERSKVAGPAPGLDELSWGHLSVPEAGAVFRHLSRMIRERRYRPQEPRPVEIPKSDGDTRTLLLRSILDRTVSAAVLEKVAPLGEHIFLPGSIAYRPLRSIYQALARMITWIEQANRPVVSQADIRKAFDNVRIADVLIDYQRLVTDTDLLWLIEAILRGYEGIERVTKIDQGDPLSPFSLNMRLHAATDLSLQQAADTGGPLWLRYADNYLLACQSVTEGREGLARLDALVSGADFTIKPVSISTVDLRRTGARTEVLGFSLTLGVSGVNVELGSRAIRSLQEALELAHLEADPGTTAQAVILGWLKAAGPTFGDVERREQTIHMVLRETESRGFHEIKVDALREAVERAYQRWVSIRSREQS